MDDVNEPLTVDIGTCFIQRQVDGQTVYEPINSRGKIAHLLLGKATQNFLIQLHCPLQSLGSLIPCGTDLGIKIQFTDASRFFVAKAGKSPKYVIKVRLKNVFWRFTYMQMSSKQNTTS